MRRKLLFVIDLLVIGLLVLNITGAQAAPNLTLANPILFVTQAPVPADFTTIGAVFGNHKADLQSVARGGDLWIRYADGTLKNLTAAVGYGNAGFQGANAIAVRDPSVHWSGTKAVFSMVIGAPTQQYQYNTYYWQLYEITGFGVGETPVISKVPNQPANYNNISPIYGTDDRIIFTSDRPRNGQAQLYPQLDEYEEAPTVTGLWSLDPATGDLFMLDHLPSGGFTPQIDSFGRVIFTRWDHLQRDQQADSESTGNNCSSGANYGTFNYADESANAAKLNNRTEVFPEPRSCRNDLLAGTNLAGHSFNQFFPWQMNEDGSAEETLNHVGRHELLSYFDRSLNDDPNVREFISATSGRFNPNVINNFLQIKEDPTRPGIYFGVDAPEFYTHASGQIMTISGTVTLDADRMAAQYYTHRDTASYTPNPSPNHSGHYREPLPLSDGTLVAAHTAQTDLDTNIGTRANPLSRYDFRLKTLKLSANGYWVSDQLLTSGISRTISYWDPDVMVSYSGNLWELNPVEVRARAWPGRITPPIPAIEQQVITNAGVNLAQLQTYMRQRNLALVVSRNVTTRDDADRQQPFNLRVAGGGRRRLARAAKFTTCVTSNFSRPISCAGWAIRRRAQVGVCSRSRCTTRTSSIRRIQRGRPAASSSPATARRQRSCRRGARWRGSSPIHRARPSCASVTG